MKRHAARTARSVPLAIGATALFAALVPYGATAHAASVAKAAPVTVPVATTTHTEWVGLDPLPGSGSGSGTVCAFGSCTGINGGGVMAMADVTVTTPNVTWGNPASLVEVRVMPGPWNCAGGVPTPTTGTLAATRGATVTPILGETQTYEQSVNATGTSTQARFAAAVFTPAADGGLTGTGNCLPNTTTTLEVAGVYEVTPAAGQSATVTVDLAGGGYSGHTIPITIPAAGSAAPNGATLQVRPALASALSVGLSLNVQSSGSLSVSQAQHLATASGVQGTVTWTGTDGAAFTPGASALSVTGNLAQWTDPRPGQSVTASATATVTHPSFNVFQGGVTFLVAQDGHLAITQNSALLATITAPPPVIKTITKTVTVPGPTRYVGVPGPTQYVGVPGPTQYVGVPGPTQYVDVPGPTRTVTRTRTVTHTVVDREIATLSLAPTGAPRAGQWVPFTARVADTAPSGWLPVTLTAHGPRGVRLAASRLPVRDGVAHGRVWVPADAHGTVTVTARYAVAVAAMTLPIQPTPWPWWWVVLAAVGLGGAAGWTQSVWRRKAKRTQE